MIKSVTIVSARDIIDFDGINGWIMRNTHKNGSRVYTNFGNFHCSELESEVYYMLKSDMESILIHTYHKHIVDFIIKECISKNIEVKFIRLEVHYNGTLEIVEDIEDVLACGTEIM